MVWFDRDDAKLTAQSHRQLDMVVEQYGICGGGGRLLLAGHTDRFGPASYNLSLSKRRAETVRAYLKGRGIPAERLVTEWFGESRPLIEVQESQNRRVEIMVGPGEGW